MRSFEDTFTAGESKQYRGGRFFLLETVTSEVDIEFFSHQGSPIGRVYGMTSGFNIDMLDRETGHFGYCEITSALAQTVKVIVGDEKATVFKTSTQITGGTVKTVGVGHATPENKNVFSAYDAAGQLASNYAYVQLLNPAASGKLLRILKCTGFIYQGTAGIIIVTTETGGVVPDSSGQEGNHYIGEATPVAQVSEKTSTTNFCTAPLSHFLNGAWSDPLHSPVDLIIPEAPVIVPEGEALVIKTIVTNKALLANFIWEEVDV